MGDWAEDKERCQVFGASRPDPGDSRTHSQVKKMTGDNNIDSNTPIVCVLLCTRQFTRATAVNPLCFRVGSVELLNF